MDKGVASRAPRASRGRRLLKRFALAASLGVLSLATGGALVATSSALAGVTVGQLDPGGSPAGCGADFDFLQPTVTSGNSYVIPYPGTITSWATRANSTAGLQMTLKIFRAVSGLTYQVVGHAGPQTLQPSQVNSFPANLAVKPGDVLGVNVPTAGTACLFPVTNDTYLYRYGFPVPSGLGDGESGAFSQSSASSRVNVSAVLSPSNSFTLGAVTYNKKKGTATLTANVPNPGELTGSGNGVSAAAATISKTVSAPGDVQLLIKATGKKKKKLKQKGKVKLNVGVTYTPTGGDPSSQSITVKLKKKL